MKTYDPFEPIVKLPPCEALTIYITEQHLKDSTSGDALRSPIALSIKESIRSDCDVLATSKQVLFYDREFDRKNVDIVLGLGRIATIPVPEDVAKSIRDFENTGTIIPFDFEFLIPKILLDKSS